MIHVRSEIRFQGLKEQEGSRDEVLQKETRKDGLKKVERVEQHVFLKDLENK